MGLSLLEGNEAVAWGALKAGCRFFAGYPITPATTILNTMLAILPPAGGVVVQGEDEIASTGSCLGAAMAGLKAMTATSGPGISLYSEQISLAIGAEIPLVIVDVMRLGPSTGSATRGADGDVQFLRWGNSGGLPVIVLVPADVKDCYVLTYLAFNLAEEYRCPVFVASNKEIGLTKEAVDLGAIPLPPLVERLAAPAGEPYLPFKPAPGKEVPYFLPIGGQGTLVRQTSSTHGEDGYITTDPAAIQIAIDRLERKIEADAERLAIFEADRVDGAETLLLTYGVTSRAAKAAVRELRAGGSKVNHLVLKTLWPVPEKLIQAQAQGIKRVVAVEMNTGQFVREVRRVLPGLKVDFFGQMNGQLITPAQIKEVVRG